MPLLLTIHIHPCLNSVLYCEEVVRTQGHLLCTGFSVNKEAPLWLHLCFPHILVAPNSLTTGIAKPLKHSLKYSAIAFSYVCYKSNIHKEKTLKKAINGNSCMEWQRVGKAILIELNSNLKKHFKMSQLRASQRRGGKHLCL